MKIIDKTPLVNENGELSVPQRVQGMLKFGFNWPTELQAQKAIVTFFDRQLEKGYTLIRNMTLGASGITVPIILLGPAGIYVIHVTYLRGRYEARGNAWNEESGNTFQPASTNLIQQTARMAAAVKAFIERQGVKLPVPIEPVLIAANPGLHVESVKPAVRVLMIDGIKSFVTGLSTAGRVLSAEAVHEFTERLVNPRPVRKGTAGAAMPRAAWEEEKTQPPPGQQVSRARAIFEASEEAKPFDPTDFDFAMVEEDVDMDPSQAGTNTAGSFPSPAPGRRRVLGMTPGQLGIIAVLGILFLLLLAVFAYLIFTSSLTLP
ncbi:MAG TPA: NERD domain-containing protein [Anaerolineales bacterium]